MSQQADSSGGDPQRRRPRSPPLSPSELSHPTREWRVSEVSHQTHIAESSYGRSQHDMTLSVALGLRPPSTSAEDAVTAEVATLDRLLQQSLNLHSGTSSDISLRPELLAALERNFASSSSSSPSSSSSSSHPSGDPVASSTSRIFTTASPNMSDFHASLGSYTSDQPRLISNSPLLSVTDALSLKNQTRFEPESTPTQPSVSFEDEIHRGIDEEFNAESSHEYTSDEKRIANEFASRWNAGSYTTATAADIGSNRKQTNEISSEQSSPVFFSTSLSQPIDLNMQSSRFGISSMSSQHESTPHVRETRTSLREIVESDKDLNLSNNAPSLTYSTSTFPMSSFTTPSPVNIESSFLSRQSEPSPSNQVFPTSLAPISTGRPLPIPVSSPIGLSFSSFPSMGSVLAGSAPESDSTPVFSTNIAQFIPSATASTVVMEETGDTSAKADWATLNMLLKRNGFSTLSILHRTNERTGMVTSEPDAASLSSTFQDVLLKFEQRGRTVQELLNKSGGGFGGGSYAGMQSDAEKQRMQAELQGLQTRLSEIEEKYAIENKSSVDTIRRLETLNQQLKQQMNQSEHRLRSKEQELADLQTRLEKEVEKQEKFRKKDKDMFEQLFGRPPKSTSAADSQALQVIAMYENQRKSTQDEVHFLRTEIQRLNTELIELGRKKGSPPTAGVDTQRSQFMMEDMRERLLAAQQSERDIRGKLRDTERQLDIVSRDLSAVAREKENIHLELDSRPSMKEFKILKNRCEQLEKQIHSEDAANKKLRDTRSTMQRDKALYRLDLHHISDLPRTILADIVQELCIKTNIREPNELILAVDKMRAVIEALPRLHQFVKSVCTTVEVDPHDPRAIEHALDVLYSWRDSVNQALTLSGFRVRLKEVLFRRPHIEGRNLSDDQMVAAVQELVSIETRLLGNKEAFDMAEGFLKDRPDIVINKIVSHFQRLFEVKSLDGILPKMNEIFLFSNEMINFLKVLRAMLGVDSSASVNACLAALKKMFEHSSFDSNA
eukprot:GILJ01016970.1.p1 GENE.GILJ01016970.1~~GILJ01016970.1.p1  ORF type:complete len:1020 (-),score=191.78 GILJ01016970.1:192-3215(-)